MPQPARISYKSEAPFCEGLQAIRIQELGSSSDLSREQILELANSGVVEYSSNLPVVTVTLNSTDYGSTDTIAMLANLFDANANQFIPFALQNTHVIQIGDPPDGTDSHFDLDANGVPIMADIVAYIVEAGAITTRTMYLPRCSLTGLTYSYSVTGFATENYTLSTDQKIWYFGPNYRMAKCMPCTYVNADRADADYAPAGWAPANILSCWVNEDEYTNASATLAIAGVQVTGFNTLIDGGIAAIDRVRIIFYDAAADTFPALPHTTIDVSVRGALRKAHCMIYMYSAAFGQNRTLRCQSVTFSTDLGRASLEQLGTERAYFSALEYPVNTTVTVTVLDSDLTEWQRLTNQASITADGRMDLDAFQGDVVVEAYLYNSRTDHTAAQLLKLVRCEACSVSGENHSVTVGDNAGQEFTFTADNIMISGTGIVPS